MSKYPEYIMRVLRQRKDLDETDRSMDDILNEYSSSRAFKELLEWEGIIGWDNTIKSWIRDIYNIDLNSK
jgi:hypothetical protein